MIRTGKRAAQMLMKARILLAADVEGPGLSDGHIVERLGTSRSSVERLRQRLVEEGLDAALTRKKQERPSRTPIFDGAAEAKLIALASSPPPQGRARWTLQLLEEKVVAFGIVARASDNTIGRTLKKRSQAASAPAMGDPARRQRRLRRGDGGRARGLSPRARSASPVGMSGRDIEAAEPRDPQADRHAAGPAGAS